MSFNFGKRLLPDRPVAVRILCGPFRGARLKLNPRTSLRKIVGLYEHELNSWIELALGRVSRVLDVGANDGYFTFGCAAAFRRRGTAGEVVAFEGQRQHARELQASASLQPAGHVRFDIVHAMVGRTTGNGTVSLDSYASADRRNTLIKIDVEGAEIDVIHGAQSWMDHSNLFVIEVHKQEYLAQVQQFFLEHGHHLVQVHQARLPLIGAETRDEANWWLVSDLTGGA